MAKTHRIARIAATILAFTALAVMPFQTAFAQESTAAWYPGGGNPPAGYPVYDEGRRARISPMIDMPKLMDEAPTDDSTMPKTGLESDALAAPINRIDMLKVGDVYQGTWKTDGDAAAALLSRITIGYRGDDGKVVYQFDDGKVALQYGAKPEGKNWADRNQNATVTQTGLEWTETGQDYEAHLVFTISEDGKTITGDRVATLKGKPYHNIIEMNLLPTQ